MGKELIRIVPLRRVARSLGLEKVVLKQGSMYVYFVGAENRAYYQSAAFGRMLNYLQNNSQRCKIREINGRRSFLISHVATVQTALAILRSITHLNPV
jgi:transcription-repair coupling factor (superfamily II helicase)